MQKIILYKVLKGDGEYEVIGGTADISGINYDTGGKPITVKAFDPRLALLAVRVPGGTHFAGSGQPRPSHPGRYIIFRIDHVREELDNRIVLEAERETLEFPLR